MEDKPEEQNRRKSERIDAAFTLTYSIEKSYTLRVSLGLVDNIETIMINLSDLGMAIMTNYDIPVGVQLYIKFDLIDMHLSGDERWRSMKINGEAVSNVSLPNENHRIGIRFDKISEEDKAAIRNFVLCNKFPHK
ncbi:MAG: PilZ domain-containing protein [Candidatus Omnitrophica bacterium]|nr:PilZ domain-containing protein [Candidatus Omnitrophota bacterium]MBU1923838.1 PilZ domain-containing protein [Candidatus Omnitrophota bacterium]